MDSYRKNTPYQRKPPTSSELRPLGDFSKMETFGTCNPVREAQGLFAHLGRLVSKGGSLDDLLKQFCEIDIPGGEGKFKVYREMVLAEFKNLVEKNMAKLRKLETNNEGGGKKRRSSRKPQ